MKVYEKDGLFLSFGDEIAGLSFLGKATNYVAEQENGQKGFSWSHIPTTKDVNAWIKEAKVSCAEDMINTDFEAWLNKVGFCVVFDSENWVEKAPKSPYYMRGQ